MFSYFDQILYFLGKDLSSFFCIFTCINIIYFVSDMKKKKKKRLMGGCYSYYCSSNKQNTFKNFEFSDSTKNV